MKAEIIAIGTELLMGQIANTNAQYLSKQLSELGIDVFYHHVVGDNSTRLKELLAKTINRSDIVITTGGLGPTQDDLTKETIAEFLNLDMVLDENSLDKINSFFKSLKKKTSPNNIKQAYFPKGAIILKNDNGTAPGCIINNDDKTIIVLPGPPRELNPMFEDSVKKYIENKTDYIIKSKMIKVFGIGESTLEHKLIDLIQNQSNPTLATYASASEVTLRITAKAKSEEETNTLLSPVIEKVKKILGNSIYSLDGESLQQVVYNLLHSKKKKVSFAESCTGGMLTSMLIDIPGSSNVIETSYVCYSNESKIENLNVSKNTLEKFGAVSKETVFEMAKGIFEVSECDIAVAISGIAGPGGGTDEKPVGRVYICLYDGVNSYYNELNFARERNYNRQYACLHALNMIRTYLT